MLRSVLLAAAGSAGCRSLVERTPLTRPLVERFVAGDAVDQALRVTAALAADGRFVTLDHLGEDVTDVATAELTMRAYVELLRRLADHGLAGHAEVSVKLSAVGQRLPGGDRIALDNARRICAAAASAGTTVTLDMEDHTTTDATLGTLRALREDFPWTGAVLQAYLRRTEQDCRDLAGPGSRVRLCKGAYAEPASVAYQEKSEVDRSYVRCLRILMEGAGYPMVATHDPRVIAVAAELGRDRADFEFQMLYGVREPEQRRLAQAHRMRVYVPYGDQWYGYFMRRLAERPANLAFFLRSLLPG
ncbi:proline dehydrogenase family protein [Amycolatopsis cynarae]|uniref:proline dehydrogenase n=1 Tax=Amycolatopsis cynarae TaxID=2995223 RepID=A0ABY7BB66_9PSEU|nr:proline dehydrogenase family protein [Amycolatopsis sp. HUAS 11-8]WAL68086.1 proline dehydrogenase family protein [Amycolatopsis sp. HUAS 11-8]